MLRACFLLFHGFFPIVTVISGGLFSAGEEDDDWLKVLIHRFIFQSILTLIVQAASGGSLSATSAKPDVKSLFVNIAGTPKNYIYIRIYLFVQTNSFLFVLDDADDPVPSLRKETNWHIILILPFLF